MPRPAFAAVAVLLLAACASSPAASPTTTLNPPASSPTAASASAAPSSTPAQASHAPELAAFAPGVVSTDAEEYRITFTPDGTTALFARGERFFPQSRQATIYETRLVDGSWTEPTVVPFSGEHPDIDPWFSPDGAHVFFSSIRPIDGVARDDAELFRVDRVGDGWSEPVHLASLGSEADELGASVSEDGTIIFASDRDGSAGWDLFVATPADDDADPYGEPRPVSDLNSPVWEFNPALSADGTQLVFTSIGRPGGSGLGDLYLAEGDGESWTEIGPLASNTGRDEYHASWSPDGGTLYFVRRSGHGDLVSVPWEDVRP
ncbi:MAG TPA: hypothetical protein VLA76_00115 [Candidatus Angelobacter sp.]|nr:hypothetical protein [Candidatus Angelobacter sp.]